MSANRPTLIALAAAVAAALIALAVAVYSRAGATERAMRQPEPSPVVQPEPEPEQPRRLPRLPEPEPDQPEEPSPFAVTQPPESSDNAPADELRPRFEAVMPKDPNGPERDWRDFNEEEKAAQKQLEHATGDLGAVAATLEDGERIEEIRGEATTEQEQQELRQAVAEMAEVYERAYDSAYASETSIIDFAATMAEARAAFDERVMSIYGLTREQLLELFPYRKDL